MGKTFTQAPLPRKPPPVRIARTRGRPIGTGNPTPTTKFIMTLDTEVFEEIRELARDRDLTVQQYIRTFIIRPWRNGGASEE